MASPIYKIIFTAGFFFLFSLLYGQEKVFYFDRIGVKNGLPAANVKDIVEDKQGFIWIGSYTGLFKFDGVKLTQVNADILDSTTISSDQISALYVDSKGDLWIGTSFGLNRMDRKTGRFRRYLPSPNEPQTNRLKSFGSIHEDRKGRLWVSTPLLELYNPEKDNFEPIKQVKGDFEFEKTFVSDILEDRQGQIWGGCIGGYIKVNPEEKTYERFYIEATVDDDVNAIQDLFLDSKGRTWLGCNSGFYRVDLHKRTYSDPLANLRKDTVLQGVVTDIAEDELGYLWIVYYNYGVARWHPETGEFNFFGLATLNNFGISATPVNSITKSSDGNLWIGNSTEVNRFHHISQTFGFYQSETGLRDNDKSNHIPRIAVSKENQLFFSTGNGVKYAEKIGAKPVSMEGIDANQFISKILITPAKEVLLPLSVRAQGILQMHWQQKKVLPYRPELPCLQNSMHDMLLDPSNDSLYWMATPRGVLRYNRITGIADTFSPTKTGRIMENAIKTLYFGSNGDIWVGMEKSFGRFNTRSHAFSMQYYDPYHPEKMPVSDPKKMLESPAGVLWIASENGLVRYDIQSNKYTLFNGKGLNYANDVYNIVEESPGVIWLTTSKNLIRFDANRNLFRYFDNTYGIYGDFKTISSHIGKDGMIYMGTSNGILYFDPRKITTSNYQPKVVITDIKVNNKPFISSLMTENIRRIVLSYAENSVSFEFRALEYINPLLNRYQYKMEGFDKDWVNAGTENKVTYTNLSPGTYYFKVKATNHDGIWNNVENAAIEVVITPLYWQTNWFRALLLLLFSGIAIFFIKNRMQHRELLQQKEIAEQSTRYKTQFLTNMSHEIRTPMNSILGLTKLLLDTNLEQRQRQFLEVIHQSSESLLVIINDILDHSKIESGKYTIVHRPFELDIVLRQVDQLLGATAREKGLFFSISRDGAVPEMLKGDATRLFQILMNLVGNAIKFTEKGEVKIRVYSTETDATHQLLHFDISDTGIGIPGDKLAKIFESFEQADEETYARFGGTGLGLPISKKLIEQQGGTITVDSQQGKGTLFSFTLPYELAKEEAAVSHSQRDLKLPEKLCVLVVDDTAFNQLLAVELLKKYLPAVVVDLADNGRIALEKVQQKKYDLILMDIKMPVMDGYEASSLIRKLDNGHENVPIIALTANTAPDQKERCFASGMNAVITKPIHGEQLLETIVELLN